MNYQKKYLFLLGIIVLFIIFICGCNSIPGIPTVPGLNPNPNVNPENNIVSYIKVVASSSTMKVNQSQQFVVRSYNSDDEWVILDKSKIKLWKWTVQGCYNCYKDYVVLNPKSGSLTTTFSSTKAGTFFIGVYYQENIGDDYITDYTEIKVVK